MFRLYKNLYGLDLKLIKLQSVSGFEIYSRAICEFKNKVIGLPYGKKVEKIKIPDILVKSKMLINQLEDMFKKLGFITSTYKWTITLNGPTMLKKWIKEIGSNNSKNINKLKKASSIVG